MKRSSHFFLFTALLVTGLFFSINAQDFSTNPNAPSETFGQIQYESIDAVTITHSVDPVTVTAGMSVACTSGGITSDNQYWRAFVLADFGITDDFDVTMVEVGIETATAGSGGEQPMTVNIYTTDLVFPTGTLTLIGTASVMVPDQALTLFQIPITGTAPAGSELVVEISIPDATTGANHAFWLGANNAGQTADSWLSSAGCGITTPVTTASIGFPDAMWVMSVTGDVGGGGLTLPFIDDFEAYTVGGQLACQNQVEWTTWSSAPCDPVEDPFISSNFAYSGTNSVVIVQNNDLVKPLGTQTSGKWDIGFMMYIPTGQQGYFNTLSVSPQTGTTEWAMQVYFEGGGAARMDAGGASSATWTYAYDTWQLCRVIVDLDLDLAEFWFDGAFIYSWQYTLGTFGTPILLQLDANNFFGATALDEMYVDDFMFGQFPFVPVELTSFTANVNHSGQVVLNWSTASETNNQLFEIERRTAEGQFATIGYVEGHGTTTEPQHYSYTDVTVTTGIYYYRLKQLDFLGSYEYFGEIEVDVNGPLSFGLEQNYPNPFNPSTKINFSLSVDSKVSLKVFDVLGQEVANLISSNMVAGFHNVDFNASGFNSGVYFYKIEATGIDGTNFTNVKKMILTK